MFAPANGLGPLRCPRRRRDHRRVHARQRDSEPTFSERPSPRQPHGDPLELEKTDEQLLHETEEACRKDPGFMLVSEWERLMSQRLENDKAR